jgi:hypothetical protein
MKDCADTETADPKPMACCKTVGPSPAILAYADWRARIDISHFAIATTTEAIVPFFVGPARALQTGFQGSSPPPAALGALPVLRI